jgi:hypothetical protein
VVYTVRFTIDPAVAAPDYYLMVQILSTISIDCAENFNQSLRDPYYYTTIQRDYYYYTTIVLLLLTISVIR